MPTLAAVQGAVRDDGMQQGWTAEQEARPRRHDVRARIQPTVSWGGPGSADPCDQL